MSTNREHHILSRVHYSILQKLCSVVNAAHNIGDGNVRLYMTPASMVEAYTVLRPLAAKAQDTLTRDATRTRTHTPTRTEATMATRNPRTTRTTENAAIHSIAKQTEVNPMEHTISVNPDQLAAIMGTAMQTALTALFTDGRTQPATRASAAATAPAPAPAPAKLADRPPKFPNHKTFLAENGITYDRDGDTITLTLDLGVNPQVPLESQMTDYWGESHTTTRRATTARPSTRRKNGALWLEVEPKVWLSVEVRIAE